MSAIVNGPKNGSRKPNDERTTSSTCSGVARPSSTILGRLPEHRELDPVGHEPGAVADDDGGLAEPRQRADDLLHDLLVRRGRGDHLHARDEQRRHEPVHAEEASRPSQPRRELRDRDRRRVRRDHRAVRGCRLDRRVDGGLHVGALDDGLDDQVGAVHALADRRPPP